MDFFSKIFGGNKKSSSKDVARERLKLVLVHDRAGVSDTFLDSVKNDIIQVINKYFELDENGLDIELTRVEQEDGSYASALVASLPIKRVKGAQNLKR